MRRLWSPVALVSVLLLASCQDIQDPAVRHAVQDGSAFGGFGNPHFFFLPPLVPSPAFAGVFDPDLLPFLRIDVLTDFDGDVLPGACQGTVYTTLDQSNGLGVDPATETYSIGWKDAGLAEGQVYRLCVRLAPTANFDAALGFRDVQPTQGGGSVAEDPVYLFNHGSNLAIKFRVEEDVLSAELCTNGDFNAGYDCTAQVLGNDESAVCDNGTCALTTPTDGLAKPTLFLIERVENSVCADPTTQLTDWLAVDIPQYAGCMQITIFDPAWDGFVGADLATVATCPDLSSGPALTAPDQDESLQLHIEYRQGVVEALPPAFSAIDGTCVDPNPEPPPAPGAGASVGARIGWAARYGWHRTREAVTQLVRPQPAWAFHTGFGGHTKLVEPDDGGLSGSAIATAPAGPTPVFSATGTAPEGAVQYRMAWALPSQMEPVTPLGTVIGNVGDVVPVRVFVSDNGRTSTLSVPPRPVHGATVHFTVSDPDGQVVPGTTVTGPDGIAEVAWTLTPGGFLTLDATGFGIGVRPASGFGGFDALGATPTRLGTGVLTFEAIACDASVPGITAATVDGHIGAGEYAGVTPIPITVNLGGQSSSEALLYVGNDCENLFLALVVDAPMDNNVSLQVVFRNDPVNTGGTLSTEAAVSEDDVLRLRRDDAAGWTLGGVFEDRYLSRGCSNTQGQSVCGQLDPGPDNPHGAGVGAFDAGLSRFVYEIAHPLASGETGFDFQRGFSDWLGFYVTFNVGGGNKGNTEFPQQNGRFRTYQLYQVQGPALP